MSLRKLILATVVAAVPFVAPSEAEAREYCREYQKTVRIGGNLESGYGTACMQPDGAWMIVQTSGTVDPFDELRRQNVVLISDQRPIYYDYGPTYRPVTYYPRHYRNVHYAKPGFYISFNNNDRRGHWDRWDRWDRRDWRDDRRHHGHDRDHGRGRGHDRHHDRD